MKDYLRIAAKIRDTPWLITKDGLDLILGIVDARIKGDKLTDEEIKIRLEVAGTHGSDTTSGQVENGVGILPIYGPIFGKANLMTEMSGATSLESFRTDFKSMLADASIKSIILDIDSPGGTSEMVATTGEEIFSARGIKPVVAIANGSAGSAAYWLGSQAEKLYVSPDGMVGSIGAYTLHEDHSAQDAQQGVKYTYISAGPYKTEGNPHEPLSREGEDYRQEMINELYDNFVGAVATGRGVSTDKVISDFGGGRMLSADKAIIAGMVDGKMEFDALVQSHMAQASQTPQFISVNFGSGKVVSAKIVDGMINLESVDYEHSEPGTGSPPAPRQNESDRGDTGSGSRRPDLPEGFPVNPQGAPGAPKASDINNGGNMDLAQLMKLFSVDSEEALFAAITTMHNEQAALAADVSLASQEMRFAKDYPDIYKQMQEDRKVNRENEAQKFVDSNKMFAKMEGDKAVISEFGLSALAQDQVKNTYLALADGKGGLEEFKACMTTVMTGGMVEYGERGSNQEIELKGSFDVKSASGIHELRKQFAAHVAEIQTQDGLEYNAAITEAAKRFPELAAAYRATATVS